MNSYENIRVYEINENGHAEIDTKAASWKRRQTMRAARLNLAAQARRESTETLRRVVDECAGTVLAHLAATELSRRKKI